MDAHHSSSPTSPSNTPPQAISRYPSSSGHSHGVDNTTNGGSSSSYGPPFTNGNGASSSLHHPVPSVSMSIPRISTMHPHTHSGVATHGHHHPHHPHAHAHAHGSYIPGLLPPGANPHEVDFRNFSAYIPNEVKHRKRTTRIQLRQLEETFRINEKPAQAVRQKLAEELSMTPRAVQVWFQNRRAKKKNQIKRADKGGGADGKLENLDDDELDLTESPSSRSLDGRGSATPPPSSTQPSPLDSIRPPHGLFPPDLHELRRGSLPISSLHPMGGSGPSPQLTTPVLTMSPSSLPPPDAAGRRRSVDASLHRLANHPYAHVARQANGIYYGPRASVANGQVAPGFAQNVALAATHGPQAVPAGALSGTYYDYAGGPTRPNLGHHYASAPYGVGQEYGMGGRVVSAGNRSRLHDSYVVPERSVPQPGPGPLPSPTYTFGSGSAPEGLQASSSTGDLSQLSNFTFPQREDGSSTDDPAFIMPSDTGANMLGTSSAAVMPPPFDYTAGYGHRFGSIAESEASFYSVASAGGSTPPSQNPSEVDLLRRASVASVHDVAWGASYVDGRKDSAASMDTAFLNLAMHRGSSEDLANYYSAGVAPNQTQGQDYSTASAAASEYAIQTATQAGFDEAAIAASRRASLAVTQQPHQQQQAGSGHGSSEVSGMNSMGMGMWPSAPDSHSVYGHSQLQEALSRRQSVDVSALMAMQAHQQAHQQPQAVMSHAQGQVYGLGGAMAMAPAASPPETMRSASVSSAAHTPPGTGSTSAGNGASMFREGANPFGTILGSGPSTSAADPLGVFDPATFGLGFPTSSGAQDMGAQGMYYPGMDMGAMGMGMASELSTAMGLGGPPMTMAGEYMQVPVPAYT